MEKIIIFLSAFLVMFAYTLMFFYYHKGKHRKRELPLKKNNNDDGGELYLEEGPELDLPPGVCWLPPDAQDPSLKNDKIKK